jgi:hypothetical protein
VTNTTLSTRFGLIRKWKVGADALFIDLDNAVDHELTGVSGTVLSRLSLDVAQRDIEQSHLPIARNRWHHEKAGMDQARFAEPAKVAQVVCDEGPVLIDTTT